MEKKLTRIAFCGCACSGKTSVLNMLKERLNPALEDEWNTSFIQEAATYILLTTAGLHPKNDPVGFQRAVSLYQLTHEDYGCVDDTKSHNLIIADRGIADAFIYVPDEAESLLNQTVEQAVKRYDAVIYFLPYYPDNIRDGNEHRYENKDELRILEQKTFDVWSKHPNIFVIPLFQTISQKVDFVSKLLNQILSAEVFI